MSRRTQARDRPQEVVRAPAAGIVNVSSGAGSLTLNAGPAFPWRSTFGLVYPASKTALNAMALAMALALLGPDGPTGTFSNSAGPMPW